MGTTRETRETVLQQATNILGYRPDEPAVFGKFEGANDRPLAFALNTIANNGFADQEASLPDGTNYCLIGRWVLRTDDQGFVDYDEFDTDQDAERALERAFLGVSDDE
jgi:hypothetical protein